MRIALLEIDCPMCGDAAIRFIWQRGGGAAVRHRCPECAAPERELARWLDSRGHAFDDRDVSDDHQRPAPPIAVATTPPMAVWRREAAGVDPVVAWRVDGAVVGFGDGFAGDGVRSEVATADLASAVAVDLARADLFLRGVDAPLGTAFRVGDRARVPLLGLPLGYDIERPGEMPAIVRRPTTRQLGGGVARYGELVAALQTAIAGGDDPAALAAGGELLALFARLWPDNRAGHVALASMVVAVDARIDFKRAAAEARRLLAMVERLDGEATARLSALAALSGVLEHWGWPEAIELLERAAALAESIPGLAALGAAYRQKLAMMTRTAD